MTYQLTAPLLDACVLGIVRNEDSYGYTLTQKARQVVDISESTLYPVLRRLQKSGYLTTYDAPYQGRNRRYYAITDSGRSILCFYEKEWIEYKDKITGLIVGNGNDSDKNEIIEVDASEVINDGGANE
ncbi:MAG: PadR family transcriptional regulator [Lachnospiraceae bacterium]|nr:PadR family transcriptional regulator [Lachnospiraceae bacterium]